MSFCRESLKWSLALPEEKQGYDEHHYDVFLVGFVPSSAVIVGQQGPVSPLDIVSHLAARQALDQGHLVGGRPLLRPVRAGAITGTLAIVEQVAAVSVLLHAEELILCVGEPDTQRHAAIRYGDILFHSDLPRPLRSTLITIEDVEEGGGGQVHRRHSHVVD